MNIINGYLLNEGELALASKMQNLGFSFSLALLVSSTVTIGF